MSQISTVSAERIPQPANRRKYPRRKPDQLIYIDMGGSNGGFLLDVSEAGLSFQGIMPLSGGGQTVHVKFKLPGANVPIQAEGQLVHPGNSAMGGGLRLVNLTVEERLQLRAWVTQQEHAESSTPGQAIPANGYACAEISETKEPVGVAPESVTAKPELPAALSTPATPAALPPPVASPAIAASAESQTEEIAPACPRPPTAISEAKVSAPTRAAQASAKVIRQPVSQSHVVTQQRPAKSSQTAQFAAGLAAGCLALVAIGGGLVAAGRMRLSWSPSEPSSASAPSRESDAHADTSAPSSQPTPAETPASSAAAPSSVAEAAPEAGGADDPSSATGMVPPTLVSQSDPIYPEEAKAANVQGSVDVLATIGTDGVPRALTATNGDTRLAAAAIAAISQWRYKPAMLNGQAAESVVSITVTFAP